ncbi:hypothetical protein NYP18_01675 [Corynebacterium sp. YIM 101645]|uniref:Uncharacterized protein n=1 Tax=Corynebacterium lemuris TaxID=1859292 RepID=A0ABT2FWC9_9CORY|nr:hypothetical protein [Corynebacterium lemuris]MCS5478357.1 hypothetical protein [Corynebacterium lemuris]
MSTTLAEEKTPQEIGTPGTASAPGLATFLLRLVFSLSCVVVAFLDSFRAIVTDAAQGVGHYSLLVLFMAAVLLVGFDRRRARALDIHDREVDYIIGGMAVILAVTVKVQLLPRFAEWDALLRLDMFAILVFSFGVSSLMLGMRSTLHFGPGWILLFLYNAPVHLLVSVTSGGGWWGPTMANIIGMSLAVTVAAHRNIPRPVRAGLLTLAIAVILAVCVWYLADASRITKQIPGVVATATVALIVSGGKPQRWSIRRREPTVKNIRPAFAAVLAATVLMVLYPVHADSTTQTTVQRGPSTSFTLEDSTLPGWQVTKYTDYGWAGRFFGAESSLTRHKLTAESHNPEWDVDGLVRTVAVDTLRATEGYQARTFGDETLYSTLTGRRSEPVTVALGHGISGRAYTVLDESDFLTYTKLVFEWQPEGDIAEKITVIAVDDHRPEARFPQLAPSVTRMLAQVATILLRGNAVTVDNDTEYKDLDLVTQVGRDIVSAAERKS